MYIPDISSLFREPLKEQTQNVEINCKLQTYSITHSLTRYKLRQYEKTEEAKHNDHQGKKDQFTFKTCFRVPRTIGPMEY